MNYRKFYKEQTKKDIPTTFDVHHIDLNKNNNLLFNLVAIPRELHQEYHKIYNTVLFTEISSADFMPKSTIEGFNQHLGDGLDDLMKLKNIVFEIQKWVDYRNFLLGIAYNFNKKNY